MPAKQKTHAKQPAQRKAAAPAGPQTKKQKLITLLRKSDGQTIDGLSQALGWLPHTVHAALTGLRKSGLKVERNAAGSDAGRYRIVARAGE